MRPAVEESPVRRHMGRRGAISGWGIFFVAALVGAIYSIVALGPVYYENLEAKQAMREVANMAYYEKSDERLVYEIIMRVKRIGQYFIEEEGERVQVSPIDVEEDQIDIRRVEEKQLITIQMTYVRQVRLPVLNKLVTLNFSPEIEGDTSAVKW